MDPARARGLEASHADHLSAVWPETARRLRAFLVSRGVPAAATEDIAQEVAVRALRSGVTFVDADDLVPWACTVGWRVHLGDIRRRNARPLESELCVDLASTQDVEEEAEGRARMRQVSIALASLAARDRRVLLESLVDHQPRSPKDASREAVLRYRARARLLRAVGGAGAALGWLLRRLRWSAVAVGLVALVLMLRSPQLATSADRADPAPRRPVVEVASVLETAHVQPPRPVPSGAAATSTRAPTIGRVFLVKVDIGRYRIGEARRPARPSDHLLCTGSFILLPHVCVG